MVSIALLLAGVAGQTDLPAYQSINFDDNWRFALGNAADPVKDFGFGKTGMGYLAKAGSGEGPVNAGFGDSKWRLIDLPHDWAIELPFDQNAEGGHGYKAIGRDYPQNSIGWYRKTFEVPADLLGKRVSLHFDGIYRDARVWCNGTFIKRNESGYIGFDCDLTNMLRYGGKNVVTVRVDASEFEGWFYEGAGIYRHTYLNINDTASLVKDGQFLIPSVRDKNGIVDSKLEVRNIGDKSRRLRTVLSVDDPEGKRLANITTEFDIKAGETRLLNPEIALRAPKLWSIEEPNLYVGRVELFDGDKKIDEYQSKIGFRTVVWDANKGLTINGKYVKIQGTCNHQDAAGVGIALPDRLSYWRIEQLKKMGCNAYRTSHNPPTPELLDACDKLGMIVLDETRAFGDSEEARSQLTRMIRRDRNHPSVIFWSIGNEEFALNGTDEGERMAKDTTKLCHELDPTRPTTYAGNNGAEYHGINAGVDIRGFNYGLPQADRYHAEHPTQPVHGSETASTTTTRGTYIDDYKNGRVSAYDGRKVGWGSGAEEWWSWAAQREWFMGGFVWTGFDYRGEPTPTGWPTINSHFGIMDTCGFPKDIYYYYQSWWTNQPVLHILPHWNWPGDEGKEKNVWVFSNADEVELFLNGKSMGRQKMPYTSHLEWKVTYQPGKLEAVAYRKGKEAEHEVVETTGDTDSIKISADRTAIAGDGKDLSVVDLYGLDAKGHVVPTADDKLEFSVEGPGKIIGVGNGNPTCLEPDVYTPTTYSEDLSTGWRYSKVTGSPEGRSDVAPGFDDSKWELVDTWENQHMAPNSLAIVRKSFEVSDPAKWKYIDIGAIDDEGWIYINGKLVKTTNVWNETYQLQTEGLLKPGTNHIAIVIKNNGGDGGFSKGVSLSGVTMPASWSRSLFNGCAQVIVQSTGKGAIILHVNWKGKTYNQTIQAN
ncbi:MAG: DUF4982 domain-containing protein [Armatimonadetes bacterium]|nr:DUF4982 domain-containing protein [Armatimonadota bacterium]